MARLGGVDEGGRVWRSKHARIRHHAGRLQQGLATLIDADRLEVAEGVAHEVDGGGFAPQRLGASVREQHGHGIEQHRGRAGQLAVDGNAAAIRELELADLWRDDLDRRTRLERGRLDRCERLGIGAFIDQDGHAAAFERVLHLADELQRWRCVHVEDRRCRTGRGRQGLQAQAIGHTLGQPGINVAQMAHDGFAHMRRLDLGQLEHQRRGEVGLLGRRLAAKEHARLAVVVGEALDAHPPALARLGGAKRAEALWRLPRRVARERARLIGHAAHRALHVHVAVALLVGKGALRGVDRQLVKVGRAQARQLRVEV